MENVMVSHTSALWTLLEPAGNSTGTQTAETIEILLMQCTC